MKRTHALAISLLVAVAVAAGGFAAFKTVGLSGASATPVAANAAVAKKKAQLARYERKLKAALAKKPPKLPALEKRTPASASGGQVVYVQATAPAASASSGSGGGEPDDHYDDGGDDGGHAENDGGGGFDD